MSAPHASVSHASAPHTSVPRPGLMRAAALRALLAALAATLPAAAQDAPAKPANPAPVRPVFVRPEAPDPLPDIEAPPALTPGKTEELGREIDKLRAKSPAANAEVQQTVIGMGRGAIPALVKAATTNNPIQMEALVHCLVTLADLRDRDVVETSLASPLPVLKRFAAREIGDTGVPALVDKLPPLLEDREELVRLEAALALLRNGKEEGLGVATLAFAGPAKDRVLAALPGIADRGPHHALADQLKIDKQREKDEPQVTAKERLAAVDLLYAIGDVAAQGLLVQALDDKHNVVKSNAINALRDLLEHQGPMQETSIFQQINEVKRLKELWATRG
jgi:HEAT repeat protein